MKKILSYLFLFLGILMIPFSINAEEKNDITLYLFHGDGCPHCADENKFLNSIKKKYDNLNIVKYEVWYNEENATFFNKVQQEMDISSVGVPTTIIGNTVIVGFSDSNGARIERAIKYYSEEEYVDFIQKIINGTFTKEEFMQNNEFSEKEKSSDESMTIKVPILGNVNLKNVSLTTSAVIIGLIDGFNPCAMWVLLFLISVLIGMKDRKRMWILGLSFLLTSALIYMLIMLSWVSIVVKITTIVWVRRIISIIAVLGGLWNIRSFTKTQDSGCEVVDDKRRKNIFKKIRKFTSEKSFILALMGVIGLAISVNLVELACSAGLPLVFTELLALNNIDSFMRFNYTILYILFFLIDDFIIFFIAMFTMKVTGLSTKYNKYSHLLGGIIMLAIGVILFFKPEWLMFQFQ